MKKLLLLSLLFLGTAALAQTSEKRDPVNQIDYEMALTKPGSAIAISTYKSNSEQDKHLVLKTSTLNSVSGKGVRIRLSNGENIIYDNIPVEYAASAPGRPNVSANILITPELEKKLEGQEIVEFTLGQIKTTVAFKEKYENLQSLIKLIKDEGRF
ncbi:hypothetical protein [Flavobacterium selenitireducens]|uniref:hypothetical protein n=1 Tax=Flavobacterium selenitireducens TaxID=2722704 RepID=UPI00168A794F|nr:hypothetical protein [Flavobacterium selenitireducens]MBD3582897.1 hypothetical protein [Flavobacterium selenitireducens]